MSTISCGHVATASCERTLGSGLHASGPHGVEQRVEHLGDVVQQLHMLPRASNIPSLPIRDKSDEDDSTKTVVILKLLELEADLFDTDVGRGGCRG